jgi:succinate dehydrogenase/fumarate reductase flavoprotein subunit
MQEGPRAAALKADRVIADGSWLMPMVDGRRSQSAIRHSPLAIRDQPSAMIGEAVRDVMWHRAGLFRSSEGLTDAVNTLEKMMPTAQPTVVDDWRALNLVTVARLIAVAALRREESRGGHFRQDFPNRNDERWRIHVVDQKNTQ